MHWFKTNLVHVSLRMKSQSEQSNPASKCRYIIPTGRAGCIASWFMKVLTYTEDSKVALVTSTYLFNCVDFSSFPIYTTTLIIASKHRANSLIYGNILWHLYFMPVLPRITYLRSWFLPPQSLNSGASPWPTTLKSASTDCPLYPSFSRQIMKQPHGDDKQRTTDQCVNGQDTDCITEYHTSIQTTSITCLKIVRSLSLPYSHLTMPNSDM
jgi:hypothetical protein